MAQIVDVKVGDAGTKVRATLKSGGDPVDLTGASVKFIMRLPGASAPKVNAAATVEDAAAGKVAYTFIAADLDTPGDYWAEWQVTFGGGAVQTFPAGGYNIVRVVDDLD